MGNKLARGELRLAAILGLTAVVLGALGAHALEAKIDTASLESFETGVRYQAWHALALLGLTALRAQMRLPRGIGWLWGSGVILFSGSIYGLSLDELAGAQWSFLGPVTPLGGLLMIAGWAWLLLASFQGAQAANTHSSSAEKNS